MKKIMLTAVFALLTISSALAQTEPNTAAQQTTPTEQQHLEPAKNKPACCKKEGKEKCAHHKDKPACDAKKDGKKDCKKKCKKKCKNDKMKHKMQKDSLK